MNNLQAVNESFSCERQITEVADVDVAAVHIAAELHTDVICLPRSVEAKLRINNSPNPQTAGWSRETASMGVQGRLQAFFQGD